MLTRDCVKGPYLSIAHYTPVKGTRLLHGHTYEIVVCVEGDVKDGFLIDFIELRDIVENIVSNINYSLVVPKDEVDKVSFEAPNTVLKITVVDGLGYAEDLARLICKRLVSSIKGALNPRASVSKVCVSLKDPSGDYCDVCLFINP